MNRLLVVSKTWKKESHGLYDFECQDAVVSKHRVTKRVGKHSPFHPTIFAHSAGMLVRNENQVQLMQEKEVC